MKTLRCLLLALVAAVSPGHAADLDYVGLGPAVSPESLRERFPASSHRFALRGSGSVLRAEDADGRFERALREGDGVYLLRPAGEDLRGEVTAISLTLEKGRVVRWIFSFERPGGGKPEQVERRHPPCLRILDALRDRYGEPRGPDTRVEEGVEHRVRRWRAGAWELALDCGRYPERKLIYAIDVEIAAR